MISYFVLIHVIFLGCAFYSKATSNSHKLSRSLSNDVEPLLSEFNLYIVYFIFIPKDAHNFQSKIKVQMQDFVKYGLCRKEIAFHVEISSKENYKGLDEAASIVRGLCNLAVVREHRGENSFEYFGIAQVWDIGQKISTQDAKKSLILYSHSKGMISGPQDRQFRQLNEVILFKYTVWQWRNAVSKFRNEAVNKVGLGTNIDGFLYGNFWWVRDSFVKKLVIPVKVEENPNRNRAYYEKWLSYLDPKNPEVLADPVFSKLTARAGDGTTQLALFGGIHSDCVTLCPPGLPIGVWFQQSGADIPCWDKETLANGTILNRVDQIVP